MADHTLDRQIGIDRLADDIKTLKNQISELRTLQLQGSDAVNLQTLDYTNLSLPIAAGQTVFINLSLTSTSGAKVFAAPGEWTLYQGTRIDANNLENVVNGYVLNWDFRMYRGTRYSDGNNIVDMLLVKNLTGGTLTLIMDIRWRFLIDSATPA